MQSEVQKTVIHTAYSSEPSGHGVYWTSVPRSMFVSGVQPALFCLS